MIPNFPFSLDTDKPMPFINVAKAGNHAQKDGKRITGLSFRALDLPVSRPIAPVATVRVLGEHVPTEGAGDHSGRCLLPGGWGIGVFQSVLLLD